MKEIILNYREFKEDGEDYRPLDVKCAICGNVSCAYAVVNHYTDTVVCKGCMYESIDAINELSQKMFRKELKNGTRYLL